MLTAWVETPLGRMLMAADEEGLSGLWFEGAKHFARGLGETESGECAAFDETRRWLETYFSGREPACTPSLHLQGSAFERLVWLELLTIPYGTTTSYGALARSIEKKTGKRCAARAVGTAVGRNPVSLILPCHRVLGADGRLTGYAAGLERKAYLLQLEKK